MWRQIAAPVFLTCCGYVSLAAQTIAQPQTARQALLEMLLPKTPRQFEKHIPREAVPLLRDREFPLHALGEMSMELQRPGRTLEVHDTGSILLVMTEPGLGRKVQVLVDSEDSSGDEEQIRLSLQVSRNGEPEFLPVLPSIGVGMKLETGIWKLNEINAVFRVPLGDKDFLNSLLAQSAEAQRRSQESSAVAALRTLNTAEVSYAASFENIGFTCSLSDLGGVGPGAPSPHKAMLIDSGLASGTGDGYVFELAGCTGNSSSTYQIVAMPADVTIGLRAFCTDQAAVIRSIEGGLATSCLSAGKPLE